MNVTEIFETMDYGPAPESREPALDWLDQHGARFDLFIANQWRSPASDGYFEVVNPASGKALAEVAQADATDIDAAVRAARGALAGWSSTRGHVRARYLYALARQVQRHSRLLSVLESLDNGKPIRESRDIDIPLVARHFYYHAGWAQIMETELTGFKPVGVVGQIIPWNFPLLMLAWKIAPAIAMGNTVVLKPAEFTPLTALAFCEMVQRAGLPPGVINIVTGDGSSGELIVRHPDVDKIAFTGSTEVGRIIRRQTAGTGKKLSLELGGKSPFIVFDDADLDSVVEGIVDAIWFNQGQVCCAGSRLLVQESIEERLLAKVRARMEKLRIGDPLDKAVDIGAIIAPVQLQKIQRLVAQGVEEGAEMWQPSWACPVEGYFFPPTLFTNVAPAATIAQVEIFGPVLVSMTFRTHTEAVELANNTPYGLAASVWSENVNLALDVAGKIKAGTIWINSTNLFDAASGFGGYRESGYGREGGREGLYEYLVKAEQSDRQTMESDLTVRVDSQEVVSAESMVNGDLHSALSGADVELDLLPVAIDRTPKMFIGGKQTRPDSGYSRVVQTPNSQVVGEVGDGNRKDIRNAVEAARAALPSWSAVPGHGRAQILYYIAENLSARSSEFVARLRLGMNRPASSARNEVEKSIERLFTFAAWADKFDGQVHQTPIRNLTLALPEPIGVMGIACPSNFPLLSFVSLVAPAIAMGNTVVAIPSETFPLAATDLYQVFDTSDVPPGVINIVTGDRNALSKVLAEHDDVDGMWYFGNADGVEVVEYASAGNMKRTSAHDETYSKWIADASNDTDLLRECTQVKNIWTPYGA